MVLRRHSEASRLNEVRRPACVTIEQLAVRAIQEKMDEAFHAAKQAIETGEENTPTVVSKRPGTMQRLCWLSEAWHLAASTDATGTPQAS